MNLRQLRIFITVAEELHFGRAAKRLHIEQSPLSRTIRKLEADLGVQLLKRTSRGAHLTAAGAAFLDDARRLALSYEHAQTRARATAAGYRSTLRIALSQEIARDRLSALLALSRQEAPETSIHIYEVSLAQLANGLKSDQFDAGFATVDDLDEDIDASALWHDDLLVVMPQRHPLLAFSAVPLEEVVKFPMVLYDPQAKDGRRGKHEQVIASVKLDPKAVDFVSTHSLMLILVAAGYGVGIMSDALMAGYQQPDVITRPFTDPLMRQTTYLLRPKGEPVDALKQFLDRALRVGIQPAQDGASIQ